MHKSRKEINNKQICIGAGIMSAHQGITLIALIITIIILLILAGVTINVIRGDNGLLKTAKEAGEKYEKAAIKEEIESTIIDIQAENYNTQMTMSTVIEKLPNKLQNIVWIEEGEEPFGKYKDYTFIVKENYEVEIFTSEKEETNTEESKLYKLAKEFFESNEIIVSQDKIYYDSGRCTGTNIDKILATKTITEKEMKSDFLYLIGSNYTYYLDNYNTDAEIYVIYNGIRYDFLKNGVYKNEQVIDIIQGVNSYEIHIVMKNYHSNAWIKFYIESKYVTKYKQNQNLEEYIKNTNENLEYSSTNTEQTDKSNLYKEAKTFFENYEIIINQETDDSYDTGSFTGNNVDKLIATKTIIQEQIKPVYLSLIASNYDVYVEPSRDALIYILYNGTEYDILKDNVYNSEQKIRLVDGINKYEVHSGAVNSHSNAYVKFKVTKKYSVVYTEDKNLEEYIESINSI